MEFNGRTSSQNTGEIRLRGAVESDVSEMFRLEQMCFDSEAFSKDQLRYLVRTKTSISYVAECNGDFAGFIIGLTIRGKSGRYGRVYTIDVDKKYRCIGIGRILLLELLKGLKAAKCKKCFLEVKMDNAGAISLYEKAGFEKLYTIPDYYSNGDHAIKMMKVLYTP
jgi:ribosomal-protein-alanine N-acetyltransferase